MWTYAEAAPKFVAARTWSPRVQPKLAVGAPGDRFEQEADRLAQHVMRKPLDREISPAPGAVQRKCSSCEEEEDEIRMKSSSQTVPDVGPGTAATIQDLEGTGRPLPPADHQFMTERLGHDFGNVRVHDDSGAAATATALGARAFTWGRHVVFGQGEYTPGTGRGRQLLAHELVHVAQQGRARRLPAEPP